MCPFSFLCYTMDINIDYLVVEMKAIMQLNYKMPVKLFTFREK